MTPTHPVPARDRREWPLTMTQAAHIARIERWRGTDADIAAEYGVDEALIRSIRNGDGYKGVAL